MILARVISSATLPTISASPAPDRYRQMSAAGTRPLSIGSPSRNTSASSLANAKPLLASFSKSMSRSVIPSIEKRKPRLAMSLRLSHCAGVKVRTSAWENASTVNAAYAIGLGDRAGSIEVGKQADLLIVNAPDYRHLAYQFGTNLVERVIKRGQPL